MDRFSLSAVRIIRENMRTKTLTRVFSEGDIFPYTREEGVVLPESVWKSTLERETFWEFARKAIL